MNMSGTLACGSNLEQPRISRSAPPGEQSVRAYRSLEELEKQAHQNADQLREMCGEAMAALSSLRTIMNGPEDAHAQAGLIAAGAASGGLSDALTRQTQCIDQLGSIIKTFSTGLTAGRRD